MTPSEYIVKLSEYPEIDKLSGINISLDFSDINIKVALNGLSAIYNFIYEQNHGWEKWLTDNPSLSHNDEFRASRNYFSNWEERLIDHATTGRFPDLQTMKNAGIQNTERLLTFDCPETSFLINIALNYPNSLGTAFQYFTGTINASGLSKESFIGLLWAYEFDTKAKSEITKRKRAEKEALSLQKGTTDKYYNDVDALLVKQLQNIKSKYEQYSESIDSFQIEKKTTFDEWFSATTQSFGTFNSDSNTKVKSLEDLYSEKLKLEEPAKYWQTRAETMNQRGWNFTYWLIGLVTATCLFLGLLLWKAPDTIFLSFSGEDKSTAIRWSVIFVTFISFIAFCVKALTKAMFSSFHLASDCNERHTLTYFYLSLKKDSTIEKEEKQLIMQSLFSRADTGLLKDDSSPSMPGLIEKIVSK